MVVEMILTNLKEFVFGSWILLGLGIVLFIIIISIYSGIGKSSILLILAPVVIVLAKVGYLPSYMMVIILIGLLLLWGLMFKKMIGK